MVGAGEEPCAVFMTGARSPDKTIEYLADPLAAKHGVSVAGAHQLLPRGLRGPRPHVHEHAGALARLAAH